MLYKVQKLTKEKKNQLTTQLKEDSSYKLDVAVENVASLGNKTRVKWITEFHCVRRKDSLAPAARPRSSTSRENTGSVQRRCQVFIPPLLSCLTENKLSALGAAEKTRLEMNNMN